MKKFHGILALFVVALLLAGCSTAASQQLPEDDTSSAEVGESPESSEPADSEVAEPLDKQLQALRKQIEELSYAQVTLGNRFTQVDQKVADQAIYIDARLAAAAERDELLYSGLTKLSGTTGRTSLLLTIMVVVVFLLGTLGVERLRSLMRGVYSLIRDRLPRVQAASPQASAADISVSETPPTPTASSADEPTPAVPPSSAAPDVL
ncbi:MAG: hypothetical protein WC992_00365 [Acholeplasmataceae bacterium]|jgi:TolA-binding protein